MSTDWRRPRPTSVWGLVVRYKESNVDVPYSLTQETRGRIKYFAREFAEAPDVCMDYALRKSCLNGENCELIHCDGEYLDKVCKSTHPISWCCAYCGDPFTRQVLDDSKDLLRVGPLHIDKARYVPIERLSLTAAVARCGESDRPVPLNKAVMCSFHRTGMCFKGKDCQMLHVCRKLSFEGSFPTFTQTPTPPTPPYMSQQQQQQPQFLPSFDAMSGSQQSLMHPSASPFNPQSMMLMMPQGTVQSSQTGFDANAFHAYELQAQQQQQQQQQQQFVQSLPQAQQFAQTMPQGLSGTGDMNTSQQQMIPLTGSTVGPQQAMGPLLVSAAPQPFMQYMPQSAPAPGVPQNAGQFMAWPPQQSVSQQQQFVQYVQQGSLQPQSQNQAFAHYIR